MTKIRAIGSHDWATFREVRVAALTDSPTAFGATLADTERRTDAEWRNMVERRTREDDSAIWFADAAHGDPIGVIAADLDRRTRDVEITSMWVAPAARGEGLARLLLEVAIEWASSRAESVSLWVTRGNAPAQRLYEATGFIETGDHKPLPSDPCKDEIRMTRPL